MAYKNIEHKKGNLNHNLKKKRIYYRIVASDLLSRNYVDLRLN